MPYQVTKNFFLEDFLEEGCDVQIHRDIPIICQRIRDELDAPLYVTSGVRSPERNKAVGGSPASSHLKGLAVDISTNPRGEFPISSRNRFIILNQLFYHGVTRIGIGETFIHFDIDKDKAQNVIWTY